MVNYEVIKKRGAKSLLMGLISYWKLDESSGTRFDSVSSNGLTPNNGVTSAAGIISNAASFASASSQYLNVASNSSLVTTGSFTFSAWVYFNTIGGSGTNATILSKYSSGGGGTNEFFLAYQPGSPGFVWANGVVAAIINPSVTTATWYFVSVDFDAPNGLMGISFNAGPKTTTAATMTQGSNDFLLGALNGFANYYMDGRIDEVGFWKRLLTNGERSLLYNKGLGKTYPFTSQT